MGGGEPGHKAIKPMYTLDLHVLLLGPNYFLPLSCIVDAHSYTSFFAKDVEKPNGHCDAGSPTITVV